MTSPLLFRLSLAPLLATIRYPFTLLRSISTILSTPQNTIWALYPVIISGLGSYIYSFHLYAKTGPANPFVKCPEAVGKGEYERCRRWWSLGLVMIGVATVTMLVLYFWGNGGLGGREKEEKKEDEGR